ncbi:MAG TPA: O-antigen ligase family protein [Pirellulales bacterium]|nr:O-antigen ligase family protein [Pirellulales bacterium]
MSLSFIPHWRSHTSDPPLLRFVDFNLAGTILFLPFVMGGRHPWGQLLLVALTVSAAAGWLQYQSQNEPSCWVRSPLRFVLAACVALLIVQLIPWPAAVLDWLSPNTRNLLPLTNGAAPANGFARWNQLSFLPAGTRAGLVTLSAYILLFTTMVQRVREISDVERVLKWIASAAIAMAAFGLLQYLVGNGKFFWFYEHPYRDTSDVVKGAYINRNHFAHFLALGIAPLIWWLANITKRAASVRSGYRFSHRRQAAAYPIWLWLGLGVVCLAGLLSLSRGGIAALVLATVVGVGLLQHTALLNSNLKWSLIGLVALLAVALLVHGADGIFNRLDEVTSGSLDKLDHAASRRQIWSADLQAIAQFPWFGAGVGAHAAVYPIYFPQSSDDLEYTHAESGYLQIALETGVVGLALALAAIGMIGRWCWRGFRETDSKRSLGCICAVSAGLMVSALHSLVDFVWYIPSCMATTVILAACAYRLWLWSGNDLRIEKYSRALSVAHYRWAALAVTAGGIWMIALSIGPALAAPAWDRYLRLSVAATKVDLLAADATQNNAGQNSVAANNVASELSRRKTELQAMIAELETVVNYDSTHVLAHVRLAAARLQWFELRQQESPLPMPLAAVSDAALQSHFSSRAQLDEWLQRATGPHSRQLEQARVEVRHALALCPLYGEAYLYLADLCFLEGTSPAAKTQFLAQALAVRPFDGEVQFEAGKECFLQGQSDQAIEHWRLAYHSGQEYKTRLIELFTGELASQVPISFFLDQFQPDLDGLRHLRARYRSLPPSDQRNTLWQYSAAQLIKAAPSQSGPEACALWLEAEPLFHDLDDAPQRLRCIQQALATNPANYAAHYAAVNCFYEQSNFDNADEQVKWCLARAPNDANLKRIRDAVVKARLDTPHDSATADNSTINTRTAHHPARETQTGTQAQISAATRR